MLPSQYYDAVDVSVDLVRRVGRMVDTLNAMSRRRSIANSSIVEGIHLRALNIQDERQEEERDDSDGESVPSQGEQQSAHEPIA